MLRDERPRQRRDERIHPFVQRIRAQRRPAIFLDEFLPRIDDDEVGNTGCFGSNLQTVELTPLTDVHRESDDIVATLDTQPCGAHGRVETARIREYAFL